MSQNIAGQFIALYRFISVALSKTYEFISLWKIFVNPTKSKVYQLGQIIQELTSKICGGQPLKILKG